MQLASLDLKPNAKKLRQFGIATAVMMGVLCLLGVWRGSVLGMDWTGIGTMPGLVFAIVGALGLIFALVWPTGNQPLYLLLAVVTFPIGLVLSLLLMALLYYGLIAPIAIGFKIFGRDRLKLKADSEASSFWVSKPAEEDPARYFRQF